MGYGEYGGGGSIAWKVDVEDKDKPPKKRAIASGYDPKTATKFTVFLEYPSSAAAQADLARLAPVPGDMKVQGTKIVFDVPVQQDNEDQIRIEW